MAPQLRIIVPPHPLIRHWLGVARSAETPTPLFRTALSELGRWLTYEATRDWLPQVEVEVETPLATTVAGFVDFTAPFAIVPILRAGLGLVESAQSVLPSARVYHVGMVRDEASLEASCYLNRLPARFDPGARVLVLEPMLATGGSLAATLEAITARGVEPSQIRVIAVIAAPPALRKLSAAFPALDIYAAMIDENLDERGYIVPGLGDAGDRLFGT